MIAAYRDPDRSPGRQLMRRLINAVSADVPAPLTEVITLGRTLKKRCSPTSTDPEPATAPPKLSTDASSTYEAPPSDCAT